MAVTLPASVYTAGRGYAWSSVPSVLAENALESFLADAISLRPDFSDETDVTSGIVVRGGIAAAFTIRRAPAWDAVGRDADYSAFAFLPCAEAAAVDFAALLSDPFFLVPTHAPPSALAYSGPASAPFPTDAPGRLLCHGRLSGFDPRAAGSLIARYGANADRWIFSREGRAPSGTQSSGSFTVTTSPWHR